MWPSISRVLGTTKSLFAGESFPSGLASDAEFLPDPGPGDSTSAKFLNPGAQVGLDLISDRGDAGNVVEHLPIRHRFPERQAEFDRLVAIFLDDRFGQVDAHVADVHS